MTNKTKWTFDEKSGYIKNAEGWVLATVPHSIAGDDQDLANGRLMAAAPELLAACRAALACVYWDEQKDRPCYELDGKTVSLIKSVVSRFDDLRGGNQNDSPPGGIETLAEIAYSGLKHAYHAISDELDLDLADVMEWLAEHLDGEPK